MFFRTMLSVGGINKSSVMWMQTLVQVLMTVITVSSSISSILEEENGPLKANFANTYIEMS